MNKKVTICKTVPTLRDMIYSISKLGGFLNRKQDGYPGTISIWRGMWRLSDIYATYKIFMSKSNLKPFPQTYG